MSDLIPLTKGAHGFGGSYDGRPLGSLVRLPRFTQLTAEEQDRVVDGVLSYQVAASVTDCMGTAGRSDSAP